MSGLWALTLKNILLPTFCKLCDARLLTEENGFFCPRCWEKSPRVARPFCIVCGRPHSGVVGFGTVQNFPCADCRAHEKRRPPFRRIYGAAIYAEAVEEAVKLLKFHNKPLVVRPLAALLAEFAHREMELEQYDCLVPVPLHKVRERERGFNQSRLLAQALLPYAPNVTLDESLQRIRPTRVQSKLNSVAERRTNVVGAFGFLDDVSLRGKTILLIDDVITTSGTVSECAKQLRQAGAAHVDVLAAALAVHTYGGV